MSLRGVNDMTLGELSFLQFIALMNCFLRDKLHRIGVAGRHEDCDTLSEASDGYNIALTVAMLCGLVLVQWAAYLLLSVVCLFGKAVGRLVYSLLVLLLHVTAKTFAAVLLRISPVSCAMSSALCTVMRSTAIFFIHSNVNFSLKMFDALVADAPRSIPDEGQDNSIPENDQHDSN